MHGSRKLRKLSSLFADNDFDLLLRFDPTNKIKNNRVSNKLYQPEKLFKVKKVKEGANRKTTNPPSIFILRTVLVFS